MKGTGLFGMTKYAPFRGGDRGGDGGIGVAAAGECQDVAVEPGGVVAGVGDDAEADEAAEEEAFVGGREVSFGEALLLLGALEVVDPEGAGDFGEEDADAGEGDILRGHSGNGHGFGF